MPKYIYKFILLLTLLPMLSFADNANVLAWTKQTLLNTLSLNYKTMDNQLNSVKSHYTPEAWQNLNSFLGDKINTIRDNQLTLHPSAVNTKQFIAQQGFENVVFWRVNQGFNIPELKTTIYFSVVVIPAKNPPYLIQSLNVTKLDD
ncbi:DotI/IcmL/TraM family protein [Legionella gresilensis]|uniref:DotI/IcmL/TraM family protein n=1 Tax=Legionella gresilensis TaxID=91823 RepID=UPI0010413BE7|nr:DotI/IcmL/TraM family protein [Legionella gresilensis]